jgi:membrane protein
MAALTAKKIISCSYQALVDTINHDGIEHAGYLAFLSILSIFPFLVFLIATVGFFGQTEIGYKFVAILLDNEILPLHVIDAFKPRIQEIVNGPPQGLLTFAILGSIWTASSAVEGLRTTLNRAYRVATPPAYIWRRLLSIAQFLILTGIIIVVSFLFIVAPTIWEIIYPYLHLEDIKTFLGLTNFSLSPVWDHLRYLVAGTLLTLVVMTAYVILPNIKQTWLTVWPGALFVVVLWFAAGSLLSTYLSHFEQVNILYGSLGGLIASLLFFYLSAMIFIYGAEFNYLLEEAMGHKLEVKEDVEEESSI